MGCALRTLTSFSDRFTCFPGLLPRTSRSFSITLSTSRSPMASSGWPEGALHDRKYSLTTCHCLAAGGGRGMARQPEVFPSPRHAVQASSVVLKRQDPSPCICPVSCPPTRPTVIRATGSHCTSLIARLTWLQSPCGS